MTNSHTRTKKLGDLVVVFGSTGYVGSRLVQRLLNDGYHVRVTYRDRTKLERKSWNNHENLDVVYCDILKCQTIENALEGASFAYYLIHSMDVDPSTNYESIDIKAAENVVKAVNKSNLSKLVYLGGLGDEDEDLSDHLRSRIEVGKILSSAQTEVITLRAAILLGSGSTSFEIMRYLVDRLPIMLTPKWTHKTLSQPIGIRNAIEYLVGVIEVDDLGEGTYDIGGPDIVTYNEMMQILARENGLRQRLIIPLPVLSPRLSARWVRLITPIDENVASRLVEGLSNDAICLNDDIKEYIPQELMSVEEAIKRALHEKQYNLIRDTYGKPAQDPPIEWAQPGDPSYAGGKLYYDRRAVIVKGDIKDVWKEIVCIGGENGWYYKNYLWRLRGYIDEVIGGPGIRRGRNCVDKLEAGDQLDCWRVASVKEYEELTLRAEMKIFGIGTLKFKIHRDEVNEDRFIVEQHASYIPRGLTGIIYWKLVSPLHHSVFEGMLREIVLRSESEILLGPKLLPTSKIIQHKAPYVTTPT